MDIIRYSFNAISPVLLCMVFGYLIKLTGKWSDAFFKQLNQLAFTFFLPCMLFCNIYTLNEREPINWYALLYIALGVLFSVFLGWLVVTLLVPQRSQKGVLLQATFRSNQAILGQPLSTALGGTAAAAFNAVSISITVPLFNLLAILVLPAYGSENYVRPPLRKTLSNILRNPLILGCMAGVFAVLCRLVIPRGPDGELVFSLQRSLGPVFSAVNSISKIGSPLMLILLGAGLDFKTVKDLLPQLTLGVFLRLVAVPALVLGVSVLLKEPLGLTSVEYITIMTTFCTPVAVSSSIMVAQLGGDTQLSSQLVVWSSALSMFTTFCFCSAFRYLGLI